MESFKYVVESYFESIKSNYYEYCQAENIETKLESIKATTSTLEELFVALEEYG
jgi:hypothetical protein